MQATFTKLETLRIPVIAAIQGGCIGGAVDMVTACCIRYATADAFFCIQEINIGMVADVGTLQRLPKLIPLGVVKELAYTGRRLPAAQGAGLRPGERGVRHARSRCWPRALQCAREIAAKPPVAIWGTKQAMHYARDHSVEDGAAADGLAAGRDLEQQPCARGGDGDEAETRRELTPICRSSARFATWREACASRLHRYWRAVRTFGGTAMRMAGAKRD